MKALNIDQETLNLTATVNGAVRDLGSIKWFSCQIVSSAASSANYAFKFQESNDGVNWTDVPSGPTATINSNTSQFVRATEANCKGRYIRPVFTRTDGTVTVNLFYNFIDYNKV